MKKKHNIFITGGSIVALVVGFAVGLIMLGCRQKFCEDLYAYTDFIGKAWVLILFVFAIPMVFAYIISSVLSLSNSKKAGKLGLYAIFYHFSIFIFGMIFSVCLSYLIIQLFQSDIPVLTDTSPIAFQSTGESSSTNTSIHYLTEQITVIMRFLGKLFLSIFAFVVILAILMTRLKESRRSRIESFATSWAEKILRAFYNFLLTMPIGVFCLIFPLVAKTGVSSLYVSIWFIFLVCTLLIGYTLVLHVFVHFFGSIPVRTFIKAMLPSNMIAISSRSSIATIPSMMEAAKNHLNIPPQLAAVIIPFFVSVFRLNSCISGPCAFIFLAFVFDIPLGLPAIFAFCLGILFLGIGTPGVPSASKGTHMPLYLAIGIPIEGYFLLKMIDTIPDLFKTNLNVTHTMTLATMVAKAGKLANGQDDLLRKKPLEVVES